VNRTGQKLPFAYKWFISGYDVEKKSAFVEELGIYRDFWSASIGVFTWSLTKENIQDLIITGLNAESEWMKEEQSF
jgi:hypothetical protein